MGGSVYDSGNNEVGYAADSGSIYDSGNNEVGFIPNKVGLVHRSGAALLLLLKK